MSIVKIRAALEKQLATVTPGLATAYENTPFTPAAGVPYQKVRLFPAETENPTYGDSFARETGFMQVLLCYPATISDQQGSTAAGLQAERIRAAFPRGASFVVDGVTVQIDRKPSVYAGIIDSDRWCVPVRIRYFVNLLP